MKTTSAFSTLSLLVLFCLGLASCVNPVTNTQAVTFQIRTIAGDGSAAYYGDNAAAVSAALKVPTSLAFDNANNLYVTDWANHAIRRISPDGRIKTVAGNGTQGYSGDGGAATSAQLYNPNSVAVDSFGNLYISDWGNDRIRKVDTSGIISTFAGTGGSGFSGDGGSALSATIDTPIGIVVDGDGNVFFADNGNHRVRKIDTTGIISTVVGIGTPGYSGDGGPATSAELNSPSGLVFDTLGRLFISDYSTGVVRKVEDGIITTVVGNGFPGYLGDGGTALQAELQNPSELAFDALGNLFIADQGNNRVRRVDTKGIITTIAGNGNAGFLGDKGPAVSARLDTPSGVALDPSGNLYIADQQNNRVRKVFLFSVAPTTTETSQSFPSGPVRQDGD